MTLEADTLAAFDENTTMAIRARGFTHTIRLGEDPDYVPGDTSARVVREFFTPGGGFITLDVTATWKKGKLKLLARGITPNLNVSPAGEFFYNEAAGPAEGHTV